MRFAFTFIIKFCVTLGRKLRNISNYFLVLDINFINQNWPTSSILRLNDSRCTFYALLVFFVCIILHPFLMQKGSIVLKREGVA